MLEEFSYSFFEMGYPKKIFFKHITPLRIYYGPNNQIIGFFPSKVEYWKYVNSKNEELELRKKMLL
jgi:hypothetical protein